MLKSESGGYGQMHSSCGREVKKAVVSHGQIQIEYLEIKSHSARQR